jgi:2-oxoglutarate dehydrogenase E2 component (dihydrolipoamide succinyltransferase)
MDVLMPQMGESVAEGTIVRWIKKIGDKVDRDEPLFEISTDKVDAEIPSPGAGVLSQILAKEGDTVPVNSVVAVIGTGAEALASASQAKPSQPAAAPATTAETANAAAPAAVETPTSVTAHERTSPLVRQLAKEHNVDLTQVHGSGIGGRITKDDVLAFAERGPAAPAAKHSADDRVEKMSVMRKKIAEHMVASRRTSAHVHTVFEVDFSALAKIRETKKISYLSFIVKAVADGLKEFPLLNASVEGDSIVYHKDINIGVAVALETGLIVPVVKHADAQSLAAIGERVADLATRARSKHLKPEDVADGTFTVTNPGAFGALLGTPIINQPQVAILGMGGLFKEPVVITDKDGNDSIAIRSIIRLTLGYDHRIIDGADADRFMVAVKNYLENWSEEIG